MERRGITEVRWFLLPGFCGGLSTFSAVSVEVMQPGKGSFSYLAINVIGSLAVVFIALPLARKYVKVR